jgi:hypothetical protein
LNAKGKLKLEAIFACFVPKCWVTYLVLGHSEADSGKLLKLRMFCPACGDEMTTVTHVPTGWTQVRNATVSRPAKPLPRKEKWIEGQGEFDFMKTPDRRQE